MLLLGRGSWLNFSHIHAPYRLFILSVGKCCRSKLWWDHHAKPERERKRVHHVYYRNIIYTEKRCCGGSQQDESFQQRVLRQPGFVYASWRKSGMVAELSGDVCSVLLSGCIPIVSHLSVLRLAEATMMSMMMMTRTAMTTSGGFCRHLSSSWLSLGERLRLLMFHWRQVQSTTRGAVEWIGSVELMHLACFCCRVE